MHVVKMTFHMLSRDYTNLEAPAALAEVRKLVDNGDYAEATKAVVELSDHPSDTTSYTTIHRQNQIIMQGSCPDDKKLKVEGSDWADLYADHLDDYQNLFHRVSLQLSKSSKSNLGDGSLEMKEVKSSTKKKHFSKSNNGAVSTVERVKSFQKDEDPSCRVFAYFFFTTRKSGVNSARYIEPA
ncbi:hypothetical protein GOBAR_AA02481 [Gossypium barbadense]|uniref:Uncharacterized protein n=1 Tax=Gossypium barbadense TaxID=3634 RepID=A0A2P5YR76_GOSBA|nr:hypothetical protein GOBAR_AA02481 [Gossypium barbadense]